MHLTFLETLGVLMIFFVVFCIAVCLYYAIKDGIDAWKELHRNKCPFCGAYLYGYQYKYIKLTHMPRYCYRCGELLNETENAFDRIKFRKGCQASLLFDKEYRERLKKFACEGCELFGNDCDGVSGNCDCGVIKEKK